MRAFFSVMLIVIASVTLGGCEGALSAQPFDTPGSSGGGGDLEPGSGNAPGGTLPGGPVVGGDTKDPPPQADPCEGRTCVGHSPLRRLTREQYHNAVKELLQEPLALEDVLPEDESFGAFRANVDSSVTDLHIKKYMSAAEYVAERASMKALLGCDVEAKGEEGCATAFVEGFGRRAFRRPLSVREVEAFKAAYASERKDGTGFEQSLRLLMQAFLQTPQFLYHLENLGQGAGQGEEPEPLEAYALAARLSFFLWNSIPDEALLKAAEGGKLGEVQGLREQAERMIKDDRARQMIRTFHTEWLHLERVLPLEKDPARFAFYDDQTAQAMIDETIHFADHVIREDDGLLGTLLTASYGFPSERTASIYGVAPWEEGAPVAFDPAQRAGLFTQPALLAGHAGYADSLPIARGVVLVERLLCLTPPPPPADLMVEEIVPIKGQSQRDALELHRTDAACASCHKLFDPIGLSLEHYDAVGRYRKEDQGKPIDASSQLELRDIKASFQDVVGLSRAMAASRSVSDCVAEHWMTFALGRGLGAGDRPSLKRIEQRFSQSGGQIRQLLVDIVTSDSFRHYLPPMPRKVDP